MYRQVHFQDWLGLGISGPELFTNMPTLVDQQLGGIIMKVVQEIFMLVFLVVFLLNGIEKNRKMQMKLLLTHY